MDLIPKLYCLKTVVYVERQTLDFVKLEFYLCNEDCIYFRRICIVDAGRLLDI